MLGSNTKWVQYFLCSDSLFHSQGDYFWEGQDNHPKISCGNHGNDLSYSQGDY